MVKSLAIAKSASYRSSPNLNVRSLGAPDKQNILIVDFDLYSTVGGGQGVYRRLIELDPQNTYFYFARDEENKISKPPNVRDIPFSKRYLRGITGLSENASDLYGVYLQCWQLAGSIRAALGKCRFDVVDTPDYYTFGLFIRSALEAHGIEVGAVVLALHGTISSALRDLWPHTSETPRLLAKCRLKEHLQYRSVDLRYALSATYGEYWRRYTGIEAHPVDPLLLIGPSVPVEAQAGGVPDVLFVGRRERRKGPDLFADIVWGLDPAMYGTAAFIGADSSGWRGISSDSILRAAASRRRIDIQFIGNLTREALYQRFTERCIVILPSRYDQFNLLALEAWRLGCPAFISCEAGAADWLQHNYPSLSDLIINIDCSRSAVGVIRRALSDYDGLRRRLVEAFGDSSANACGLEGIQSVYTPMSAVDERARQVLDNIIEQFGASRPQLKKSGMSAVQQKLERRIHKLKDRLSSQRSGRISRKKPPIKATRRRKFRPLPRFAKRTKVFVANALLGPDFYSILKNSRTRKLRMRMQKRKEDSVCEIEAKLFQMSRELGHARFARVHTFREFARLEQKRDGDLIAATYYLRVMRWIGHDRYGDLDFVLRTLQEHNFSPEAEVAHAMFSDPLAAEDRCLELLETQYKKHLEKPDLPLEICDDRRAAGTAPKVSVIVSLYNAADKLATLLKNLSLQFDGSQASFEIVLLDSGSPSDEYQVFKEFIANHDLSILYARSKARETIQAAWNRGIKLARSPYLCFLGADEGLHPDALAVLSEELDKNKDVDWVMADSLVTEVDKKGVYSHDVMPYDRSGYDQNLVYLETCYLSWVGGLYRKSIHDRFGYYDETFRAAGDTEFKGRVLKHIKTLHVPKMLGVFNNYPEERTTQHPRAEIEDLRAWYLHRTLAGIRYSFDSHPISTAEDLFRRSLCYRKSFCTHLSTDFDMASIIGRYLQQRGESGEFGSAAAQAGKALLDIVRSVDTQDLASLSLRRGFQLNSIYRTLRKRAEADMRSFDLPGLPRYGIFNDNRHEQHWWSWSA